MNFTAYCIEAWSCMAKIAERLENTGVTGTAGPRSQACRTSGTPHSGALRETPAQ